MTETKEYWESLTEAEQWHLIAQVESGFTNE